MSPWHDLFAGRSCGSSLRGRRVLVVEDEFLLAQDLLEELLRCDAEVMGPVGSVAEALALLQSRPIPYMAILDIKVRTAWSTPWPMFCSTWVSRSSSPRAMTARPYREPMPMWRWLRSRWL